MCFLWYDALSLLLTELFSSNYLAPFVWFVKDWERSGNKRIVIFSNSYHEKSVHDNNRDGC